MKAERERCRGRVGGGWLVVAILHGNNEILEVATPRCTKKEVMNGKGAGDAEPNRNQLVEEGECRMRSKGCSEEMILLGA